MYKRQKVVRALTADEIEENHRNAMHYVCLLYTSDIPYQELRIGEIGYVIGEKWHGKGYGTEACLLYTSVQAQDGRFREWL